MKLLVLSALSALVSAAAIPALEERQLPAKPYNVKNFFFEHTPQTGKVTSFFDVANPSAGLRETHCSVTLDCANGGKLCEFQPIQCASRDLFFGISRLPASSGNPATWLLTLQFCQGSNGQVGSNYQFSADNDVFVEVPKGSGKTWEAIIPRARQFTATGSQVPPTTLCSA